MCTASMPCWRTQRPGWNADTGLNYLPRSTLENAGWASPTDLSDGGRCPPYTSAPIGPTGNKASAGFTLIEIMVVMVIMAIAAAIVFAGMSNQGDIYAQGAARTIMGDLLYAQNRAIATQQKVYINFNTTGSTQNGLAARSYALCSSLPVSSATYLTNPVSQAAYTSGWSKNNWSVSSVNLGGQASMYFDVLGTPYSCDSNGGSQATFAATGTVIITSGNNTVTISIQPDTGDITVQ